MKTAWFILIISAFTDFVITVATALTSAMVVMGTADLPSRAVVLLAVLGGLVSASRTVQQALKATPETSAALKGDQSIVSTSTVTKTP